MGHAISSEVQNNPHSSIHNRQSALPDHGPARSSQDSFDGGRRGPDSRLATEARAFRIWAPTRLGALSPVLIDATS